MPDQSPIEWRGFCPICRKDTVFRAENDWLRDNLRCQSCAGGSLPRERAIMLVVEALCPNWASLNVHESSPCGTGLSLRLFKECKNFVATQFLPDTPRGTYNAAGFRSENLEWQTFPDRAFDLVITQDVFEHLLSPGLATAEIWRTLKPGGYHIFTTPIYKDLPQSQRRAISHGDSVHHLAAPEYRPDPVNPEGCLVAFHYGRDFADLIASWAPFKVVIRDFNDRANGIVGEFTDVVVCQKPRTNAATVAEFGLPPAA